MPENIIPPRLKGVFAKRPQFSGKVWRKRVLILIAITAALFVIGHLGVRFILWPQIEKSKASITKSLTELKTISTPYFIQKTPPYTPLAGVDMAW